MALQRCAVCNAYTWCRSMDPGTPPPGCDRDTDGERMAHKREYKVQHPDGSWTYPPNPPRTLED